MVTLDQLKAAFDEKADVLYSYLGYKNRGGANNAKGASMENFFAVYKISLLYNIGVNHIETNFTSQDLEFIDDLIIELNDEKKIEYYQIKDVQGLKWTKGERHTIEDDFYYQNTLSVKRGQDTECCIVVSREDVANELIKSISDRIGFAKVQHFETASSITTLLQQNKEFREEIVNLCALDNPSSDKLDAVATILLGAWDATDKNRVSMDQILEICYKQNPHYIRGIDKRIPKVLETIFLSIDGFSFEVQNGFIVWKYKETDNGTISYPIGTKEYLQWENDLSQAVGLNNFESLEPYLV